LLTFQQARAELEADGNAVAQAIATQTKGPEPDFARHMVESYTLGVKGNTDAQTVFVEYFEQWRAVNMPMIVPLATRLGHPQPGANGAVVTAPEQPADPQPDIFAQTPAPAAQVPTPAQPIALAPVPAIMPVPAPSVPATTGRKTRVTWAHADIVNLTKVLAPTPVERHALAISEFDKLTEGKYGIDGITAKAVELELTPAGSTAPVPVGLTDDDEKSIADAIVEWIAPEAFTKERRLLRLKYAGTLIRELAKTIT